MTRLSIRWRVMLWNTAAFTVVLMGFGIVVYALLRQTHYDHIDAEMTGELAKLTTSAPSEYGTAADRVTTWVQATSVHDEFHAVAMPSQGGEVIASTDMEAYSPVFKGVEAASEPRVDTLHFPGLGQVRRLVQRQSVQGTDYDLAVIANLRHVNEEMTDVVKAIVLTVPVTLVFAAALAYFLACKALAPVDELRKRTDEITAERLDRRLPIINSSDELGQLAQTINAMIGRLEASFLEVRRFTGDASHELRTPLAIIRSDAELGIDESGDCEAARDRFSSILEECNRLTLMTEQLLVLSREDAGLGRIELNAVDLVALLEQVVTALQPLAAARELETRTDLCGQAVIAGDADRLRQVFFNLLDNAFKFTPAGGTVSIRLVQEATTVAVEVVDSGQGIPPEHLERIFDRFYRVEKQTGVDSGFGLGLSIVKSIVTAHGGRIGVQSSVGAGTTVRVAFPQPGKD